MKFLSIAGLLLACAAGALAQGSGDVMYQTRGNVLSVNAFEKGPGGAVTGAPYSATITNEMTQTLEDGSHIVQTSSGNVARDSEGRTRQDAPLPNIGNLSATNAPHIVFVQDPVAQVSYTLDLTDKTAQKMPLPSGLPPVGMTSGSVSAMAAGPVFTMQMRDGAASSTTAGAPPLPLPPPAGAVLMQRIVTDNPAEATTEDLGSQTMQGVTVIGKRTTRTIPVGQIGNDAPISIVNEVWTSPELKTVVYSKRSDPRMGVQTFQLTNIVRAEPDASLFAVPADFKVVEGPQAIVYRTNQ